MRICVVADLHGRLPKIPECDVLVIAGDICPDFHRTAFSDPDLMRVQQMTWLSNDFADWENSVPAKYLVATPGNHDWITKFPEHCRSILYVDELVELDGVKFYFTPWTSPAGPWNYDLPRDQRQKRFRDIPRGVDVLVAHSPAYGCMDKAHGDVHAGCQELRAAILDVSPAHFVFGHIHEGQRFGRTATLGHTFAWHASMWGAEWQPVQFEV